jgi:predicted acyl esterase
MTYKVGDIEVLHGKPGSAKAHWTGIQPATAVLPKGHRKSPQHREFVAETIFERDVEIPMRDGTVLRGDVFRPSDVTSKVPAIIAWSPYGKTGTGESRHFASREKNIADRLIMQALWI